MTSPAEPVPPLAPFLNSVCPGIALLDDNTHFALGVAPPAIDWPMDASAIRHATLGTTYLNIARPPLGPRESTTYVSLPHHVRRAFLRAVEALGKNAAAEGQLQIAANVNPLVNDPFKLVHMNPGCLCAVVDSRRAAPSVSEPHKPSALRNPFNKLNLNKLLSLTYMAPPPPLPPSLAHGLPQAAADDRCALVDALDWSPDRYDLDLKEAAQLLVAAHVSVLNVVALDSRLQYCHTAGDAMRAAGSAAGGAAGDVTREGDAGDATGDVYPPPLPPPLPLAAAPTETPILRVRFDPAAIVTALKTFHCHQPYAVCGFASGQLLVLNLADLSFHTSHYVRAAVTSLEVLRLPSETLVVAGFANGEVLLVDPHRANLPHYDACVQSHDAHATYFVRPELGARGDAASSLVGHFKLSHKPITLLALTVVPGAPEPSPVVLAVGADDGFVRLLDFAAHGRRALLTDVVSNYFNDGISCVAFSPDAKFLCVAGKGDLIEMFRVAYYNVNALLKHGATGRRSRSNTVGDEPPPVPSSPPPSSPLAIPSVTFDSIDPVLAEGGAALRPSTSQATAATAATASSAGSADVVAYAPMVKEVNIVARFKGHANTVRSVQFAPNADHATYKLVLCGYDGKVMVWDFDYKALPRVKHAPNAAGVASTAPAAPAAAALGLASRKRSSIASHRAALGASAAAAGSASPSPAPNALLPKHSRTLSWSGLDEAVADREGTSLEIVTSVYKSLYDLRLRKHYARLGARPADYTTILHPVVSNKSVPSIDIPLVELDLSPWVADGKIDGAHIEPHCVWCFAKSGDVFRYSIA